MYTVVEYLSMLEAADRAPATISNYRDIFLSFARFLDVPLDELHKHLLPENLIKYAAAQKGRSGRTTRTRLSVLRAYYQNNSVILKPMEMKVLTARRREDQHDKPLDIQTLQAMMDIANVHGRAILTFLISTGIRPGEAAQVLLSDVESSHGGLSDIVHIRPEIAKGGRGGIAFLTKEAEEFLSLWLKERPHYLEIATPRARQLGQSRPMDDQRLFACSYTTLHDIFINLYKRVDGERGKYGYRITPHSCRKYFRTQAPMGGLSLDIVETIMRHEGYLTESYRRFSPEEVRREFHLHEDGLYITRRDRRQSESAIAQIRAEKDELGELVALLGLRVRDLEADKR